ncbi:MAG: glycosyltransferase, partial [Victivallaceae bacterium]|nr:glycosyltransferase [Victivallaceae bacterium]
MQLISFIKCGPRRTLAFFGRWRLNWKSRRGDAPQMRRPDRCEAGKLSVIVPVWNAPDDVKRCLEGLDRNLDWSRAEVILVDDCSAEETHKLLVEFNLRHPDDCRLLVNERNSGFIASCNAGLAAAGKDVFVLLNSDTLIPPTFARKILDCFAYDRKIGVASPVASRSALCCIDLPERFPVAEIDEALERSHPVYYPDILPEGFCYAIRREVYEEIGALDLR